jgi:putative phosphoribosyl transferase
MTTATMARETRDVRIPAGDVSLRGDLSIPAGARGVVVFAHGSGSSRHSPRNQYVARVLRERRLATLLIDLLTPQEETIDERTAQIRFDVPLLAKRLTAIMDWLRQHPDTRDLPAGLFGASTGAGAALLAAAGRPGLVSAVVSRGGRPDLAGEALERVRAPTLLIVGGLDTAVIRMNRAAMQELSCEVEIEIVPGASHLFEEPGTLGRAAELAAAWFGRYLRPA